jgi:hypothetical protein
VCRGIKKRTPNLKDQNYMINMDLFACLTCFPYLTVTPKKHSHKSCFKINQQPVHNIFGYRLDKRLPKLSAYRPNRRQQPGKHPTTGFGNNPFLQCVTTQIRFWAVAPPSRGCDAAEYSCGTSPCRYDTYPAPRTASTGFVFLLALSFCFFYFLPLFSSLEPKHPGLTSR